MKSTYDVLANDLKRLGLWLVPIVTVAVAFILYWDIPLAWYFEKELDPSIHKIMGMVTEAANSAIWFGLAAIGLLSSWVLAQRTHD
ncbi:MAG: hypothetical protein HN793_08735, partial [Rhodospirillaceae bacterium]|nr:hypothetical protein [Rhodospirillaceae bacterium]